MDFTDPFHNTEENIEITGWEPVLGGQLAEKAVWVDEAKCIGCQYCVHSLRTLSLLMNFMVEVELLGKMEIVLMSYKKQ